MNQNQALKKLHRYQPLKLQKLSLRKKLKYQFKQMRMELLKLKESRLTKFLIIGSQRTGIDTPVYPSQLKLNGFTQPLTKMQISETSLLESLELQILVKENTGSKIEMVFWLTSSWLIKCLGISSKENQKFSRLTKEPLWLLYKPIFPQDGLIINALKRNSLSCLLCTVKTLL